MPERMSASNISKHVHCHASANLEVAIPGYQPPDKGGNTKASIKGTDIHKILENAGEYTPKEMLGISEAMRYVAELRMQRRFTMLREVHGEGWWLQQKPPTTADVVLHVSDELHIVDYKFGKIPVSAQGNTQGMYYSLAFLPLAPKAKHVTFHILQPFAKNFDSVQFSMNELDQFRKDTAAAEQAILAGSTQFMPGDHCQFCPANPHTRGARGTKFCPAMLQLLYPRSEANEEDVFDILDN